jgi:glucuronate isomerase
MAGHARQRRPEKYITGDATPYEKFLAWARTVPYTLRNPLYHWTHLELQRYFGIYRVAG